METDNSQNDPKLLMQLAKAGDAEAFGRLYELYFVPVFRYIYFRVKNKEESDDLAQTVFLKAFRSLPRFEPQNKAPLGYFFTIARNTVIDHWRKTKQVAFGNPESVFERIPDNTHNPLDMVERQEDGQAVHRAILELTDDQQEVVVLKFINGMANRDIAALMGKTEEAVRQLQCRAIRALRQTLVDQKHI